MTARHRSKLLVQAGLAAALLTLAAGPALAAEPKPMRVAVLEFVNASSDEGLEVLGKGLQSMVTTDLSKVDELTLVERARLQEILDEQKLSSSGLIDQKTAAKVGKLAGASHLLGGTYTVHGDSMRLDARLFTVKGGDILLAEDITGERDAFFELEKSLVRKLVSALGIKLAPKERAGIARIHTADFGAFKQFSEGVAQFDAKRYEAALESLRAAMKIDASFDLARVTLDEYEALVSKIRSKAQKLELTERELARLKADQVAQNDSEVAQRLVEIAGEQGKGKRMRRLAALSYLIGFYNPYGRNHGRISRFQDRYDGLVLRRRIDALARRYLVEAQDAFPDAPLFSFGKHPPDKPEDVPKRIDGLAKALGQGLEHRAENRDRGLLKNLSKVEDFAKLLCLDHPERIRLTELALAKMEELKAEPRERIQLLEDLAELHLETGDVDAASGALARASALMTNPRDLKSTATKIEELGELSKLMAQTDKRAELRELIAGKRGNLPRDAEAWFTAKGPAGPEILDALADLRSVKRWYAHADPYWFLGDEPAHLIQGEHVLYTGPRKGHLRSDDLRYYKGERMSTKDVLVAIGRGPQAEVDASFVLRYEPARDFWPRNASPRKIKSVGDLELAPGEPEVSFVFGLHDVDTDNVRDPETRKSYYPSPTQGHAIRLGRKQLELVRVGEDAPSEKLRLPEMTAKVLGTDKPGTRGARVKVRVRVKDGKVRVDTDGETARFSLRSAADGKGFVGFLLRGQGYVEIEDFAVK